MAISNALAQSSRASGVGIAVEFEDFRVGQAGTLPARLSVIGQGASAATFSTTKVQFNNSFAVGTALGFGSPLHLAAKQLFPANGDGVGSIPVTFYPLLDDGSADPSVGDITPAGTQTAAAAYVVRVNNIDSAQFVIGVGDSVATIVTSIITAMTAELSLPLVAADNTTDVLLTSKWKGTSANDIVVEVVQVSGPTSPGTVFGITQPAGGLVNPDVDTALVQFSDVWETLILNCMDVADSATLDKYNTFGELRWNAVVKRFLVVFSGNTATAVAAATAVSDARKTDRVNNQLVAPGSNDLPFVVAARQLAKIAVQTDNNPATSYQSLAATGLTPGLDSDQWTFVERDEALKKGSSTIRVKDDVVLVEDAVTFFHPDGDDNPAFRYVVTIIKLQNIVFRFDNEFSKSEWAGAPLIKAGQFSTNPNARSASKAKTKAAQIIDNLALDALISDPETAKANMIVEINGTNPNRLDFCIPVQVSGNTNQKSIDIKFGFFFGTA